MTLIKDILKSIINDPLFAENSAWTRHCFHNDDIIINEGDEGGSIFLIEKGKLRVSGNVVLEQQKHIQAGIWELTEGDVFGELALQEKQIRSASVRAITDGCLIEIKGELLLAYLGNHPEQGFLFYKEIFEILISKLNQANHRVIDLFAWGLKVHDIDQHL